MSILTYESFSEILNKKIFEGSYSDLIKKIVNSPDRYIGLFRPTKPRTKLLQNITQSHEIKFGDALEIVFEEYFKKTGFEILEKKININNQEQTKDYSIDQLIRKNNKIYFIEQKVRDDHDSTKKVGQFSNFENKYFEISNIYPDQEIISIMWFVDDSLKKNRAYYTNEMLKMNNDYGCNTILIYGEELFNNTISELSVFDISIWKEIIEHLEQWKETLPDVPEINFDKNADDVFNEIKDIMPSIYRRMFANQELVKQILPIIFPDKIVLNKLSNYYDTLCSTKVYKNLSNEIKKYIIEG